MSNPSSCFRFPNANAGTAGVDKLTVCGGIKSDGTADLLIGTTLWPLAQMNLMIQVPRSTGMVVSVHARIFRPGTGWGSCTCHVEAAENTEGKRKNWTGQERHHGPRRAAGLQCLPNAYIGLALHSREP